jgi:adenylosuccinate lyase
VVRSAVMPALENVTLWHERDISHSSTERYIAPDATGTLDFALNRIAGVVEQLVVYADRMKANLDSLGGLVFSQRILLALTQKGMSREASYAAVQRNAMEAWRGNASLLALCRSDKEIREFLADDELVALFDMRYHTKHVDTIFKRVFG